MLSDEEKEALRNFKNEYETCDHYSSDLIIELDDAEIILNLIEKQSKEIEELKNITKSYDSFLGDEKIVIADKKFFVNGYFQENFVSKDKIKAKIEELQEDIKYSANPLSIDNSKFGIKVLQSLLEKE